MEALVVGLSRRAKLSFGLLVFSMRGRWSPRAAKRDFEDHERLVAAELAKIEGAALTAPVDSPELVRS